VVPVAKLVPMQIAAGAAVRDLDEPSERLGLQL
jgi:hypothetical protein